MLSEVQDLTAKIGLPLHEARNAQKLSRQTLSDRLGGILFKSRLFNYKQGPRRLGIEEARLVGTTLGTVSATYLLCLDDEMPDEQEQDLLLCFRQTDDQGKSYRPDVSEVAV